MDKIWSPIQFCINWILEGVRIGKIVAIITAIGVFLGPYLAARARRKHRKREEHFIKIKEEVFRHLLNRLLHYHLPIIQLRKTNVTTKAVPLREESRTIDKRDRSFSNKLVINKGGDDMDSVLYEDTKKNHFEDLFMKFEDFENRFMQCSKKCLQFIDNLKDKIVDNIKLKDYIGIEESYIHAGALAIFIFEKAFLLGREDIYLRVESVDSEKVLKDQNRSYARGYSKEIEECHAYIKKLFREVLNTRNFLEDLKSLEKDANEIKNQIREILFSQDLPGNCKFI